MSGARETALNLLSSSVYVSACHGVPFRRDFVL